MNVRPDSSSEQPDDTGRFSRRSLVFATMITAMTFSSPTAYAAATKTTKKKKASTKAATATAMTAAKSGSALPTGKELAITYTYTSESGGRARNPYMAVWIEDPSGAARRTLEVSFEQGGKGRRYLHELVRWSGADQVRQITGGVDVTTTVSSATRLPGSYSFVWDGRDDAKAALPSGDYVVCIEAAREHGPYSLVKEPVTLGADSFKKTPADNNELTAITIELRLAK